MRLFLAIVVICASEEPGGAEVIEPYQTDIDAAVQCAETVLEHGRDTYGERQTPLFVDALNVDTMMPPAKIPSWRGVPVPGVTHFEVLRQATSNEKDSEAGWQAGRLAIVRDPFAAHRQVQRPRFPKLYDQLDIQQLAPHAFQQVLVR